MTTTTDTEEILKTDSLGRVKTPAVRREALLDEFERSGLSGAKFAALVGVKYQTFAGWVYRRRRGRDRGSVAAESGAVGGVRWLEAVIDGGARDLGIGPECVLKVELPGGARLEIANRGQAALAAELLSILGGRAC